MCFYQNFWAIRNGYLESGQASGSDLIDAGTDVGLDYEGDAPDIGAFESDY